MPRGEDTRFHPNRQPKGFNYMKPSPSNPHGNLPKPYGEKEDDEQQPTPHQTKPWGKSSKKEDGYYKKPKSKPPLYSDEERETWKY